MARYSGVAVAVVCIGLHACADADTQRLKNTTKATYDVKTGRLTELTHDANKDGRIDTWTDMDGARPLRSRIDRNDDGKIDRWEYYDANGALAKVGFSRRDDGIADAWAYSGADGKVHLVEMSSNADEKHIDRWEHYDPARTGEDGPAALVSAEEDTNRDGKIDKWETYARGVVQTVSFDEDGNGTPDRRLTYRNSALVLIESQPDGAGGFISRVDVK